VLNKFKKKLFWIIKSQGGASINIINNGNQAIIRPTISNIRVLQRFNILLLSQNNVNEDLCAWYLNCHPKTVHRCMKRIEMNGDLEDQKRSGRPPIITEDMVNRTIAFYCQQSPLPGCTSWSYRLAANYLDKHPETVGDSISRSSIHRILTTHSLRPHRNKYFLQIRDPDFFPKMEHIITLYLHPPEYLFCFDECTSIQALERIAPVLPALDDKPAYKEFEYRRHGTTGVIAFLRPNTGKVFAKCASDHKTATLIEVFREHVCQQPPNVELHYIADNYSTHYTDAFCSLIAELSGIPYTPLKEGKERRAWLQSHKKRIYIHFLPTHGSWLNMIEIWFGILKAKCLKDSNSRSVMALNTSIYNFTDMWNIYLAHPFNWKYTGEDLYEKAVVRLSKWLTIESKQMDKTMLKKQMQLMINLVSDYWAKVKESKWVLLGELLSDKKKYIMEIIGDDDKVIQIFEILTRELSLQI
jgi:transposase